MNSLDMLCFLIGFAVGSVAMVIMVRYKQQKALKLMQHMNKSKPFVVDEIGIDND